MSEIKLKPCPFCGGKAIMMRLESLETGFVSYYVSHSDIYIIAHTKSGSRAQAGLYRKPQTNGTGGLNDRQRIPLAVPQP